MMDLFNNNPTCWSQLTLIQRNEGISPKELDDLVFDVNIKKLTNLDKLKLEFFFAGCSLAFSKEECQAYICKLIDSTSEMRPIRQIAGKHFDSSCKPKEHIIPKDTDGVFIGPHLDGEGNGTEHRSYLDLFCSTYTTLIENKLAHLMHRSRIKDLVSYLGNDEKAKTLAARLISYRCYGHHGLQIVEYKRELLSLSKKKKKLTELLEHSEMKELNYFKDHHKGMLERLEGITNMQEHVQNQLLQENKDWKKNLQLYYFPVQSYKPGNFSFIIDEVHQKLLTNAYTAITDLNEWSFFDDKPPQANGYIFCSDPRFYRIAKELKRDNHSARSLSNSMYTMRVIRAKGWTYFVNKTIDENGEKLGMVQYARANIRAN